MKNLITMTDFVLQRVNTPLAGQQVASVRHNELEKYRQIFKYANFLDKPLKLEMFVLCDEEGNILDKDFFCSEKCTDCDCEYVYQKAKEKVIFEGFELCPNNGNVLKKGNILIDISKLRTIEDLIPYNLKLTDNLKFI
jgi:hypothetical protein